MQRGGATDKELFEYLVTRFAPSEQRLLGPMKERARAAGVPNIQIALDQASFLRVLVSLAGVERALDVGTLFGFSAATLATAMGPKGRVVTLELDARNARVAKENLAAARLGKRVRIIQGPALESMKRLRASTFDLVLIDADKENYTNYLEEGIRVLRHGGLLLADNTLAFGKLLQPLNPTDPDAANVRAIRAFNEAASDHPHLDSTLLTIGDGLLLARVDKKTRRTDKPGKPKRTSPKSPA